METNVKRIENSKAEMSLKTSWDNVEKEYNTLLDKYQKQLTLPGFRKGKAPRNVVEKKIGKELLNDAAFEAMNNSIKDALKDIDPHLRPLPYTQPEVIDIEKLMPFAQGKDIEFTTRFDVTPEIKLEKYKGLEVEYPNVEISDEMINTEIERYRNQNAEIKTKEGEIANGDLVTIDYAVLDNETNNGTVEDYTFTVGDNQNYYKFDDMLIGLKTGDTKEFTKKYDEKTKPENLNRDEAKFKVTIKNVRSKILPELNDEFAQDVKSEYKTVEDMKKGIKDSLEKSLENRMRGTKFTLVADKIVTENPAFEIPKSMVDFEVNQSFNRYASQIGMKPSDFEKFINAQGQTKEQFTSTWAPEAEKELKRQLVVSKIGELEKVEADKEKVESMLNSQLGDKATDEQKEQYRPYIKDSLDYEAAIDYMLENNKLTPSKKKVTYEDFASGAYLTKSEEK